MGESKRKLDVGLEGIFSSALSPEARAVIMATPGILERHMALADLAASWVDELLISPEFYRILIGHPIRGLARQTHRAGIVEWGRRLFQMGDPASILGPASQVLGREPDSGKPVLKREYGIDDRGLEEVVRQPEYGEIHDADDPLNTQNKRMLDGISLHPDVIARLKKRQPTHDAALPAPRGRVRPRFA